METGRFDVFAKGPAGELVQYTSTDSGNSWSAPVTLLGSGSITDDPAAVSVKPGAIHVFGRYDDLAGAGLYTLAWDAAGGWGWQTPLAGSFPGSSLSVASSGVGSIGVAWQDSTGRLRTTSYSYATRSWDLVASRGPLYSPAGSKVGLSALGDNVYRAYSRGSDDAVYFQSYG